MASTPSGSSRVRAGRTSDSRPPPRGRSPPSTAIAAAVIGSTGGGERLLVRKRGDETLVAFLAGRHPFVQPFKLEQAPVRRILPAHGEERADEVLALRGGERRE